MVWANLGQFGPIWVNLSQFGFNLDQFGSIWANLGQLGPIWVHFGFLLALLGPIWGLVGPIWGLGARVYWALCGTLSDSGTVVLGKSLAGNVGTEYKGVVADGLSLSREM